jgi:methionyl-tRNA formyltransferase
MMRIVLIGAVGSTEATLERLVANGMSVVAVFGYRPPDVTNVSGYVELEPRARVAGVPFHPFRSINDPSVVAAVRRFTPDVLFVVGLSQLIGRELLETATRGAVGYHPTALPEGRGRAPIAWMVLERRSGASTFFELTLGADEGGIFVQEPFAVDETDDAGRVEAKVLESLRIALDRWLPRLKAGEWRPVEQRHELATFYGKRAPEDGLLRWSEPAEVLDRLVKASTHPHPGAFSFRGGGLLRVWRSRLERDGRNRGVAGRVLLVDDSGSALVQAGKGLLWLVEYEAVGREQTRLRVGEKLGFDAETEIHSILGRLARLEERSR